MTGIEVQVELVKKVLKDWVLSDDCNGVEALVAIMDILGYDSYSEDRAAEVTVSTGAGN